MLIRGLLRRCPRCGSGTLFRGWFQMVERCPRCGYTFEREESFFLGAYVINLAITQVALGLFITVWTAFDLIMHAELRRQDPEAQPADSR
jgi:uncharacterized protein (DUF983 family)